MKSVLLLGIMVAGLNVAFVESLGDMDTHRPAPRTAKILKAIDLTKESRSPASLLGNQVEPEVKAEILR